MATWPASDSSRAAWDGRKVVIGPNPGPLTQAEATLTTPAGRILSRWQIQDGTFHLEVEIPGGRGRHRHPPFRRHQAAASRGTGAHRALKKKPFSRRACPRGNADGHGGQARRLNIHPVSKDPMMLHHVVLTASLLIVSGFSAGLLAADFRRCRRRRKPILPAGPHAIRASANTSPPSESSGNRPTIRRRWKTPKAC